MRKRNSSPLGIDTALRHGLAALKCASLLRESLWGVVSHFTSTIDFDYTGYAREYLARFDHSWRAF